MYIKTFPTLFAPTEIQSGECSTAPYLNVPETLYRIRPLLLSICMTSDRYLKKISSDMLKAKNTGISSTPAFVLGACIRDTAKGNIIVGAQPLATLKQKIDAMLTKQTTMLKLP